MMILSIVETYALDTVKEDTVASVVNEVDPRRVEKEIAEIMALVPAREEFTMELPIMYLYPVLATFKVETVTLDKFVVLTERDEIDVESNLEVDTYKRELRVNVLRTIRFKLRSGVQLCLPLELTVKTYPSLMNEPSGL